MEIKVQYIIEKLVSEINAQVTANTFYEELDTCEIMDINDAIKSLGIDARLLLDDIIDEEGGEEDE